jgi:putative RNA 2'-phosphotransferase
MNEQEQKRISKNLSYVLRHRPDSIGLELEMNGWVAVERLLAAFETHGQTISLDVLKQVVTNSDKRRFEFSDDGLRIRARQGHSVEVDLGYQPAAPPNVLYHGTAIQNLGPIFEKGLLKGKRHHVHLSTNKETMIRVGMRHGKPVLLTIDSAQMHADGYEFFVTGNDVWLTDHVPPKYLAETPVK